jgi:orotate phosphoribosyltransferase-like protein
MVRGKPKRKREAALRNAMKITEKDLERYENGEVSAKGLAEEYECARETMKRWLEMRGVRIRGAWESPAAMAKKDEAEKRAAKLVEMREKGMTGAEISEKIGVSRQRVFQITGTK